MLHMQRKINQFAKDLSIKNSARPQSQGTLPKYFYCCQPCSKLCMKLTHGKHNLCKCCSYNDRKAKPFSNDCGQLKFTVKFSAHFKPFNHFYGNDTNRVKKT